ncbi:MAG TPA: hypothetical protein VIJ38_17180, partial [Acidobacteriaceae bacterium]
PTVKPASLKLVGANETKAVASEWTAKKPAETNPVATKVVAKKAVPKKVVAKKAVWKKKTASGMSSANEKEFAALAAAHKAALAKASKSGGARP